MLRVVHTLGGCGGTLLSRCWGVLPGVVLLSEINPLLIPFFTQHDPLDQDRRWLHLLSDTERHRFSKHDLSQAAAMSEVIGTLCQKAEDRGLCLILRDFNYAEFIGVPFVANPPRRLVFYECLSQTQVTRSIGLVRHPVDQWASLRQHSNVRRLAVSPSEFADAYVAFVRQLGNTPILRFEGFVADPAAEMRRVCDYLELPFDAGFQTRFQAFDGVTGNFGRRPDGAIQMPARRQLPESQLLEFREHAELREVAASLGYVEFPSNREAGQEEKRQPRGADLRSQVEELRIAGVQWFAEAQAKEAEIQATHAIAAERLAAMEEKDRLIASLHAEATVLQVQLKRAAAMRWRWKFSIFPWVRADTPSGEPD